MRAATCHHIRLLPRWRLIGRRITLLVITLRQEKALVAQVVIKACSCNTLCPPQDLPKMFAMVDTHTIKTLISVVSVLTRDLSHPPCIPVVPDRPASKDTLNKAGSPAVLHSLVRYRRSVLRMCTTAASLLNKSLHGLTVVHQLMTIGIAKIGARGTATTTFSTVRSQRCTRRARRAHIAPRSHRPASRIPRNASGITSPRLPQGRLATRRSVVPLHPRSSRLCTTSSAVMTRSSWRREVLARRGNMTMNAASLAAIRSRLRACAGAPR